MPEAAEAVPGAQSEQAAAASCVLYLPGGHAVHVPSFSVLPISVPGIDAEALLKPLPAGHDGVDMGTQSGWAK